MISISKQHIALLMGMLFGTLMLHDHFLYPFFNYGHLATLALLRLVLIVMPIIFGFIVTEKKFKKLIWVAFAFWVLFIPYTIYSTFEIRHIAEACHLSSGTFYTQQCVAHSWQILPTFVYALAGTLAFVLSVTQIATQLFPKPTKKIFFIVLLCFYTSLASIFGLYTRINVWELFYRPGALLTAVAQSLLLPFFWTNVFISTTFFVSIFLVVEFFSFDFKKIRNTN